MEKYSNRREVHRKGGRFAKPKTLEQLGFSINTGGLICEQCGKPNLRIIQMPLCWDCTNSKKGQ